MLIAQNITFRTYNGKDIYRRPKRPAPYSYDLRQKVINAIEL
ncbi:IS630 family transposase, partial [Limnospira fusiformis CCALA 023]